MDAKDRIPPFDCPDCGEYKGEARSEVCYWCKKRSGG